MINKDSKIKELLKSLEEKFLNPSVRKSADDISQLLADDFIEFGSSGKVYNKRDTVEALQKEYTVQITLSNFKMNLLTSEAALVTYTAVKKDNANNETTSLRSSVWKKAGEKWQIVFHQGTNNGRL